MGRKKEIRNTQKDNDNNMHGLRELVLELGNSIDKLNNNISMLISEVKLNTYHMIKLKVEVKKAREIDEQNIKFMQGLITSMVQGKQKVEVEKWKTFKNLANWGLKIVIVLLLAFISGLGIKTQFFA